MTDPIKMVNLRPNRSDVLGAMNIPTSPPIDLMSFSKPRVEALGELKSIRVRANIRMH